MGICAADVIGHVFSPPLEHDVPEGFLAFEQEMIFLFEFLMASI
jgi:hypothetical protein